MTLSPGSLAPITIDGTEIADPEEIWFDVRLDESNGYVTIAQVNSTFGFFAYAGTRHGDTLSLLGLFDDVSAPVYYDADTPAQQVDLASAAPRDTVSVCVLHKEGEP